MRSPTPARAAPEPAAPIPPSFLAAMRPWKFRPSVGSWRLERPVRPPTPPRAAPEPAAPIPPSFLAAMRPWKLRSSVGSWRLEWRLGRPPEEAPSAAPKAASSASAGAAPGRRAEVEAMHSTVEAEDWCLEAWASGCLTEILSLAKDQLNMEALEDDCAALEEKEDEEEELEEKEVAAFPEEAAQDPGDEDVLPEGWEVMHDPVTGSKYYWNSAGGESIWSLSDAPASPRKTADPDDTGKEDPSVAQLPVWEVATVEVEKEEAAPPEEDFVSYYQAHILNPGGPSPVDGLYAQFQQERWSAKLQQAMRFAKIEQDREQNKEESTPQRESLMVCGSVDSSGVYMMLEQWHDRCRVWERAQKPRRLLFYCAAEGRWFISDRLEDEGLEGSACTASPLPWCEGLAWEDDVLVERPGCLPEVGEAEFMEREGEEAVQDVPCSENAEPEERPPIGLSERSHGRPAALDALDGPGVEGPIGAEGAEGGAEGGEGAVLEDEEPEISPKSVAHRPMWTDAEREQYVRHTLLPRAPLQDPIVAVLMVATKMAPMPAPWAMTRTSEGRLIFMNGSTGATTWSHPLEASFLELAMSCRVMLKLSAEQRVNFTSTLKTAWIEESHREFSQWYSAQDEQGREYWCHEATKETMWSHPSEVILPAYYMLHCMADKLADQEFVDGVLASRDDEHPF